MSVDLRGLAVGSAWRVCSTNGHGTLVVRRVNGETCFSVCYDSGGFECLTPAGLSYGAVNRIESILHELKPVADITAADLDGRVIETDDGGYVFFADGHACVYCPNHGGDWGFSGMFAGWFDEAGDKPEDLQVAYAAELERRRNPPVVIQWQGECRDDDGTLLSAWCEVRGEKWRVSRTGDNSWLLYRGRQRRHSCYSESECEQYIRDHYASTDRATST